MSILGRDRRVSITNVAVIALIAKLALSPSPDLATVGVTAVSILNYMHRRSSNPDPKDDQSGPNNS